MDYVKKLFKNLFSVFLLTLIPSLLIFCAEASTVLDNWVESGFLVLKNIELTQLKDYILFTGIIINFIFVTARISVIRTKNQKVMAQRLQLISMMKNMFVATQMARFSRKNKINIDIRIWVPKAINSLCYKMKYFLFSEMKREFIIKNILPLANTGLAKDLCFEVYPSPVGLVGECYKTKKYQYDDELKDSNDKIYGLSLYQINKTSDVRFAFCCPILSEKENVIAIVAYDTVSALKMPKNKAQKDRIINDFNLFSQILYETLPELFEAQRC